MPAPIIIKSGQKFGRLVAINRVKNGKSGHVKWNCKCECGSIVSIRSCALHSGNSRSCGCLQKELVGKINYVHGMSTTSEYKIWQHIINRCSDSKNTEFKNYGGRGITVCDEWQNDFMAFYNHVGPRPSERHSIDRIDNNGNYEHGNVRWATQREQHNNKRSNHPITINGKTMNIAQWATFAKINRSTLIMRIRRGWSPESAIFKPSGKHDDSEKTINGKTMNLKRWALFANIKYNLVCSRINRGWPLEKALFHPVRKQ